MMEGRLEVFEIVDVTAGVSAETVELELMLRAVGRGTFCKDCMYVV
jgi:hypothetical protein